MSPIIWSSSGDSVLDLMSENQWQRHETCFTVLIYQSLYWAGSLHRDAIQTQISVSMSVSSAAAHNDIQTIVFFSFMSTVCLWSFPVSTWHCPSAQRHINENIPSLLNLVQHSLDPEPQLTPGSAVRILLDRLCRIILHLKSENVPRNIWKNWSVGPNTNTESSWSESAERSFGLQRRNFTVWTISF